MRLTLAGDLILSRSIAGADDPQVLPAVERIRQADLAIANLECVFAGHADPPAVAACGPWLGTDPDLVDELPWLGIGAVSRANNHAGDFGAAGIARTSAVLDRAGVRHAGVGADLGQARAATFIDLPAGRVALISCASTFTLASMAVASRADVPGAPGLSPLRFREVVTVTAQQAAVLHELVASLGPHRAAAGALPMWELLARVGHPVRDLFAPGRFALLGSGYEVAEQTGLRRELAAGDRAEVLGEVAAAAEAADIVVLAVHSHELGAAPRQPDPLLRDFAHDAVAAGATVVLAAGPHRVGGVEVHRGRLILYGLGSLVFQYDGFLRQPAPAYEAVDLPRDAAPEQWLGNKFAGGQRGAPRDEAAWVSVIAELEFAGRTLVAARLVPIQHQRTGEHLGNPRLAEPETADNVRTSIAALSASYGTSLDRDGSVGL